MREIKFRGKRHNGEWVYGSLVYSSNSVVAIRYEIGTTAVRRFDWCYVNPDTVGQYTGLKDKNGNEIYEGDIVLVSDWTSVYASDYNGVVKMIHCTWVVEYEWMFGISHPKLSFDDFAERKTEVIGNIYDNPELLKDNGEESI